MNLIIDLNFFNIKIKIYLTYTYISNFLYISIIS